MKQIELVIQNQTGLHARPAKVLVNLAKKFESEISLQHAGKRVNAKSMVSVLTLGVVAGSCVTLQAEGVDEDAAICDLEAAIRAGLGDSEAPAPVRAEAAPVPSVRPVEAGPSRVRVLRVRLSLATGCAASASPCAPTAPARTTSPRRTWR